MKIIAYLYSDPLLEVTPNSGLWGWEIEQVYQDIGNRENWQELLKYCAVEKVDYLLVRKLEELGDSVAELSDRLSSLELLDVKLIVTETAINLTDLSQFVPANRIALLELINYLQKQYHSRSIRKGHAKSRLKAIPPPGKAPYGYKRGKDRYALDRAAAGVVKEFFEHFLLYGSLRGAVRHIEKKYGKKIAVSTGHRWLSAAVYRGHLEYQNGEMIENTHVAIISKEEGAQIDRWLRRNQKLAPKTASAPRSLAGLVVCQKCLSPMTVTAATSRGNQKCYLYLRPVNCQGEMKCRSLVYDEILALTIRKICTALPSAIAGLKMPNAIGIKGQILELIKAKQAALEELPKLTLQGILDRETEALRSYKLRTEMATLQNQLAALPPVNLKETALAVSLPEFWQDLSESERRFYLREFVKQIQVIRDGKNVDVEIVFIFS